ncbi:4-coumarate--CoA ligase-like 9 [Punica granatum]|uniref:4-coumarate--CoA ligase-like 9 n=1 Tax=Punica granatum TaxID=22663 RepID=A0A6P8BPM8_PUNGR|nr:4-coumarate--CoA ligase-like 9 [Punica granatum]
MARAGDDLPPHPHPHVNPSNGFCSDTRTYHSLRPQVPLPPVTHPHPLSVTDYALSLLPPSVSSSPYIIDAASDQRLTFSRTLRLANSLSLHLRARLSKSDVAFILLPPSFNVPIIYLSLGVVVSPSNPLSSASEIAHQIRTSNPSIAFATSSTSSKLPPNYKLRLGVVLVDSPEFESVVLTGDLVYPPDAEDDSSSGSATSSHSPSSSLPLMSNVNGVHQSDPATILYSSGPTGRVKGVLMTHRNLISMIAGRYHARPAAAEQQTPRAVCLFALPPFHSYGFFVLIRSFVQEETLIWMQRFEFEAMLRAVEKFSRNASHEMKHTNIVRILELMRKFIKLSRSRTHIQRKLKFDHHIYIYIYNYNMIL